MSSISSELLCVLGARIWYKQGEKKISLVFGSKKRKANRYSGCRLGCMPIYLFIIVFKW